MPAVLVHGVPDTTRVWSLLRAQLGRDDVTALAQPGFGNHAPAGFTATKEDYVDWLLRELRAIRGPIDLVGHDWGGLLVVRAVSVEPGLVRTWAAGAAPLDPDYVWHTAAQRWQTPEVGEQVMARITPELMAAGLAQVGVPPDVAAETGRHVDGEMKRCILALYRSAVHVGAEWTADLERVTAPGLVLWGADDPYAEARFGERLAQRTGARFVSYPACGHWWQLQRPAEVAGELRQHWAVT